MERPLVRKKSREYIKYVFSEDEKKQMAADVAQNLSAKDEAEQKLKEVSKQIKADIEAYQSKISVLSKHYSQGYAFQNADCILEYDLNRKVVTTFRKDNEEFISERPIKPEEMQGDLFEKTDDAAA